MNEPVTSLQCNNTALTGLLRSNAAQRALRCGEDGLRRVYNDKSGTIRAVDYRNTRSNKASVTAGIAYRGQVNLPAKHRLLLAFRHVRQGADVTLQTHINCYGSKTRL